MSTVNRFVGKLDKKQWGILLGSILPIITLLCFWKIQLSEKSFQSLMKFMVTNSKIRDNVAILTLLPNLILFYFSNFRLKLDRFTVGLVLMTIVFALLIAILILI